MGHVYPWWTEHHVHGEEGWAVILSLSFKRSLYWDFPGGPVVKTSLPNAGGASSIPGQGAEIPHALQPKKPKHKAEAIL